jgi:hypothetical protein
MVAFYCEWPTLKDGVMPGIDNPQEVQSMRFRGGICFGISLAIGAFAFLAGPLPAAQIEFDPPEGPALISDGADSNKVKLLRTPDGALFAVYGEAVEVNVGAGLVWDAKKGATRKPYDIMIKYSWDDGESWSSALNLSNTAHRSSAKGIIEQAGPPLLDANGHPNLAADPNAVDYPGDSEKPNVFNVGNRLLVTWVDKFCDASEQRYVVYPELYGVTIPYSCMYAARLEWNPAAQEFLYKDAWGGNFKTDRLSSGRRDAKQDANRGNPNAFVLNWQEDPLGLQLGSAEGPGDGASGANVHHGTDIWYSYLAATATAFDSGAWAPPVRITRNVSGPKALAGREVGTHPQGLYDHGQVGASRPNIGQIGPQVIIAYEETKGSQGWDTGKVIRYHYFHYTNPPAGGEVGILISDPRENARRVRFLVQAPTEKVPLLFIYKQGQYSQGGPSDILLRRAVGGYTPDRLDPPIDVANSRASIVDGINPLTAIDYGKHQPGLNFSGTAAIGQPTGTAPYAATGTNYLENALAHRGMMRGDTIVLGYSYVPDLYRFTYLNDQKPYNFYVRRSIDAGVTWSSAVNLSPSVTAASGYSVREPRIASTPGNGPLCLDPLLPVDPIDCQNPNVLYVAYGLQENVYAQMEESADVDIYMMVSTDSGASWSAAKAITAGDALGQAPDTMEDFETQIKIRPDGQETYTVWSGNDGVSVNALFRRGLLVDGATVPADEEKVEKVEKAEKPEKKK